MPSKDRIKKLSRLRSSLERACSADPRFKDAVAVFGRGPAPCALMVVGEAPGRDETRLKTPFVGKAGSFFVAILEEVFGRERDEFYITNTVKVWPTIKTVRLKTRKPSDEEVEFFLPYLRKEIETVAPQVILAVGKTAFSTLAPGHEFAPGKWTEHPGGVLIMPVYHPSYILRRQKDLKNNTERLKEALRNARKRIEKAV
ncbi:MAG: uracil-DNA glycosylase [Deltaproteobacteria bacterium]|nr:uracil-DNA glycosylase [Deltaproteobacteria bacterium]